jgi:3-isopropylmalate dehydrogenase
MTKKVCVVPGDDAAPEAVNPTVEILEGMKLDIEFLKPLTGAEAIAKYGTGFPAEAKKAIDEADCTLFGAASKDTRPILAYLKMGKMTLANIRPTKYARGMKSPLKNPEGIDFVVARENLEGLYPNSFEGDIPQLSSIKLIGLSTKQPLDTSMKGKFAVRIITEENTRNICEAACKLALKRKSRGGKGLVTVADKYNNLPQTGGLFCKIAEETVARYPSLTFQQLIIDNCFHQLVLNPQQFDVIILPNELGDVFTDGAAALIGGLGLAPSAVIGKDYAYFEPIHGTAPDIAGKDIINPTATILSAVMMLEYLGFEKDAERLEKAVYAVYSDGKYLTRDQGGQASTTEFCLAVKAKL